MIMNEVKCPKCGAVFKIDEQNYDSILKQIRNHEFTKELENCQQQFEKDKKAAIEITKKELETIMNDRINTLNIEIINLKNELKNKNDMQESLLNNTKMHTENEYKDMINALNQKISNLQNDIRLKTAEHKSEVDEIINEKEKNIVELKSKIVLNEKEFKIKEQSLKDGYESKLKSKDEMIDYYKDLKVKQSTKMIGETLEQHCSYEFNKLRPLFKNAYFEKDNDVRTGSKGDFIFRDYDDNHDEIVSIMFEMKNEADTTSTKHKNEDFFKELDKDRKEKNCEYAVLVSFSFIISSIRPQFFIPIITLIRGASLKSLEYKQKLIEIKNQNIDISNFEENINSFKEGFSRNYRLASEKFKKAIEEIDKTIDHLQKTKDALISSENNLRLANNKADDLTIKRLTTNNPTMSKMFENIKNGN